MLVEVLFIVVNVTRDNIVPDEELLNKQASPNVVLASVVAKVDSALQLGGAELNPVVVKLLIDNLVVSDPKAVFVEDKFAVLVPTAI